MIYKYGIDFGTTNSSIAMRFIGDDKEEHTLVVDVKNTLPRETIPSVVLFGENGHIYAGVDALNRYMQGGLNSKKFRYIKKIKLDLEKYGSRLEYQVGNCKVKGVDLIAEILKTLRLKAEKEAQDLGLDMSGVVMGVPVQYGDIQKNVLKEALLKAGFYKTPEAVDACTEFVSEPIAVAVHYGLNLTHDTTVLVFDFGGGTLDLAIVNLKNQVSPDRLHPHQTLSKERITLGGEELTRLFFINSFCNQKKYGLKRICGEFGFNKNLTPVQVWEKLLKCEDGIRFIEEIEKCKCDLSKASKYRFSFIGPNIQFEEKIFYRDDFTAAIESKLEEIDELIDVCLENGNITDAFDIDYVILAGGSSMIPAVQDLLIDRFGRKRVSSKMATPDKFVKNIKKNLANESEVLTSIVRGLAMVGCKNQELIDDLVDSDYGVWDSIANDFIPIIRKGTPVKKTTLDIISKQGMYEAVECIDKDVSSVEVCVYQRNLTGEHQLGIINIPNPGGKKYRIYMQVDKKKGTLEVTIYDTIKQRWIDEIPLNERQYTLH